MPIFSANNIVGLNLNPPDRAVMVCVLPDIAIDLRRAGKKRSFLCLTSLQTLGI